jgi:hypothetical protein
MVYLNVDFFQLSYDLQNVLVTDIVIIITDNFKIRVFTNLKVFANNFLSFQPAYDSSLLRRFFTVL